ncbi:MAG: hypothetical protein M1812_000002 [Candelaria pacifica]|nr:MAG: hypothetical protein M1812_000002 [Candelaria pacifica]
MKDAQEWHNLVSLIQQLQYLEAFRWAVDRPMPAPVLDALNQKWPTSKLFVDSYKCWEYVRDNGTIRKQTEPLNLLPGSAILYSIKANIAYGCGATEHEMGDIYKMLISSPNVRILELSVYQGGCKYSRTSPYTFPFQEGHRFPPLERLVLNGYEFHDRRLRHPHLNETEAALQHAQSKQMGIEAWYNAMDWTRLRHLGLHGLQLEVLLRFHGCLPGLRSLHAGPKHFTRNTTAEYKQQLRDAVQYFVSGLRNLEELSLHGFEEHLPLYTVTQHGPTLRSLEILERETSSPGFRRPVLTLEQLEILNETCPLLTKLSLDLNRNGEWPWKYFDALTHFRSLRELELWAEANEERGVYRELRVDKRTARMVFDYLRSRKLGVPLSSLSIYLGDFDNGHGGGRRGFSWAGEKANKFVCALNDTGKVVVTNVVESRRRKNAEMRRLQDEASAKEKAEKAEIAVNVNT